MAAASTADHATSALTILGRILQGGSRFPPALARHLLKLGVSEEEKARMHDLAVRNQHGQLTQSELEELHAFAEAGCLLGVLQSKARRSI